MSTVPKLEILRRLKHIKQQLKTYISISQHSRCPHHHSTKICKVFSCKVHDWTYILLISGPNHTFNQLYSKVILANIQFLSRIPLLTPPPPYVKRMAKLSTPQVHVDYESCLTCHYYLHVLPHKIFCRGVRRLYKT